MAIVMVDNRRLWLMKVVVGLENCLICHCEKIYMKMIAYVNQSYEILIGCCTKQHGMPFRHSPCIFRANWSRPTKNMKALMVQLFQEWHWLHWTITTHNINSPILLCTLQCQMLIEWVQYLMPSNQFNLQTLDTLSVRDIRRYTLHIPSLTQLGFYLSFFSFYLL